MEIAEILVSFDHVASLMRIHVDLFKAVFLVRLMGLSREQTYKVILEKWPDLDQNSIEEVIKDTDEYRQIFPQNKD